MTLPIYIAGGSSEIELCSSMVNAVTRAGGRITYDWTRDPVWKLGRPLTMQERAEAAARDLAAVAHTQRGRERAKAYALEHIKKANPEWWPTVEA